MEGTTTFMCSALPSIPVDRGRCALATAALLLLLAAPALGAGGPCVTIADISPERTDIWAYQMDTLTVVLENGCGGLREVEVLANPSGRFAILGERTVRLVLEERRELVFNFYPMGGTAGPTHLPVVVTDRTGGEERMAGAKAELYVANPLVQWWYAAAVLCVGLAYVRRRWLIGQLELSPVPLVAGIWLLHRGYLLATRHGAVAQLVSGGTVIDDFVVCGILLLVGALLVAFGRPIARTVLKHPLALVLPLYILTRIVPTYAWASPDAVAAWSTRSLVLLREEALFVLALPLYVLGELGRLYPLYGTHTGLVLVAAAYPTIVYWRWLAHMWHATGSDSPVS